MAGRFDFVNPGASAVDALTQLMVEREAKRRQDFLDSIALRRENRADELQRDEMESRKKSREVADQGRQQDQAAKLAALMQPGQEVDDATAGILNKGNLGILIRQATEAGPTPEGETEDWRQTRNEFAGTPAQLQLQRKQSAMADLLNNENLTPQQKAYIEAKMAGEDYNIEPSMFDTQRETLTTDERNYRALKNQGYKGTFEQFLNEDANRKKSSGNGGGSPYFTPQTAYNSQGIPVGTYSFDARTGKATMLPLPIEGTTLKPPPTAIGNQTILNDAALASLDNVKKLFDEGGSRFVGPASGRWESFKQAVPGFGTEADFNHFAAANAALTNEMIRAITGAAVSAQEQERIMRQIPAITDKPEVWLAKYDQTQKNFHYLADVVNKAKGNAGAGAPPPGATTPPPAGAPSAPKVGDEKVFPNGRRGRFDGKGWIAVN